jgi:hypothetical protein
MDVIDPRVPADLLPANCRALIVAEHQEEYVNVPAIVTPRGQVITRWELTDDERRAIFEGADVFVTLLSAGRISPFRVSIGPIDWKATESGG